MYHVIDRKIQMITVNSLNLSIFKWKKAVRSESDHRHLSNVTKFQSNVKFNFRTVLITMYSASLHAINSVVTQFNFYPHEIQLFQTKMSQYSQKIRLPKKWRQKKIKSISNFGPTGDKVVTQKNWKCDNCYGSEHFLSQLSIFCSQQKSADLNIFKGYVYFWGKQWWSVNDVLGYTKIFLWVIWKTR